jgi:hypothetical protein
VDFSVSGHIHRYIHTFCLRVLPKRYQVTQLQHSVYTLDAAIVEGYRHGTVHSKCVNDHTKYTRVFTYPHILHTGKKVRLQIRIDHKMFDIFTSRNVKKKYLNIHSGQE